MDVVIRDTKTIAEFKAKKAIMEARAADCYAAHRAAFENWTDGDPRESPVFMGRVVYRGVCFWSLVALPGDQLRRGRVVLIHSGCVYTPVTGVFFYYQSMVYLLRPRSWSMVRVCIRSSIS